jgi:hypothetical protein
MKGRLLFASTLFLFAQMPTMQAQESLDLAKITSSHARVKNLTQLPYWWWGGLG